MDNQEAAPQTPESDTPEFQVVDKRKFVNLDTIDETTPVEASPRYPSYVEELMARVAETEKKFLEKKQQIDEEITRTKARLESDFSRKLELERREILLPFLEVLDNLERAMDAKSARDAASSANPADPLLEGVRMTAHLFLAKLRSMGATPMDALGRPFDPNTAQAVGTIEVSDPASDGVVLEEVQKGYALGEQLLRPAQVRVGRLHK